MSWYRDEQRRRKANKRRNSQMMGMSNQWALLQDNFLAQADEVHAKIVEMDRLEASDPRYNVEQMYAWQAEEKYLRDRASQAGLISIDYSLKRRL